MRRYFWLFLFWIPLLPEPDAASMAALIAEPRVSAQSYVLMDADTGKIWSSLRPETRLPMASTTKIMTAYAAILLSGGKLSQKITVSKAHTLAEGSRMYLRAGEVLPLEELLYGLLLSSGNDAALAIAEGISGSVSDFVAEMNDIAAELSLSDTHFTNPSGLPDENHYSTAQDMAKLMAAAMALPEFAEITGTREKSLTGRFVANHNRLLSAYPGVDGGKTGFTKAAGRCLVTTASQKGRRLIAVTLNAPSDWNDHTALYDYGFSLYSEPLRLSNEDWPALAVVGSPKEALSLQSDGEISLFLTASERKNMEIVCFLPHFVYAPVERDLLVGRMAVFADGRLLKSVLLYTEEPATYGLK